MSCSPRLYPVFRNLIALRKKVVFLVHILYLDVLFHPVSDVLPEILLNGLLNDENHLLKARLLRIENGEVNNQVSIVIHWINLL